MFFNAKQWCTFIEFVAFITLQPAQPATLRYTAMHNPKECLTDAIVSACSIVEESIPSGYFLCSYWHFLLDLLLRIRIITYQIN